ncbi:MAG: FtsX-like permease family protein [Microthrixaceae bacterium]|nr:FtsX-like permease family protein [Microthrixaceae bacterium]
MSAVLERPRAAASTAQAGSRRLAWLRERGMGATILVAAISSAFGVILIAATGYITSIARADPYLGESGSIAFVLGILTVVFVGLAVYIASIVTANTFATVIAGRTRQIALLRLIGASARSQRQRVAAQGLVVGVLGALAGLLGGIALAAAGIWAIGRMLGLEGISHTLLDPAFALPAIVVALTTWAAAWSGSRAVLRVTPLQALAGSVPATHGDTGNRRVRGGGAIVLLAAGAVLLGLGVLVGLFSPLGVLIAFVGGVLSFTGIALGAVIFMPPVLRLIGRLFGGSVTARLAAQHALRHPARSSRMAIGVVMGVALVTMFAVALESMKGVLAAELGSEVLAEFTSVIDAVSAIMMGLVGVSAVIAAVGMVNLLTIGVVQRRRELGLLRALGLSNRQVRAMVMLEAAHIAIAALVAGLALGIVYGWAGAQSAFGSISTNPLGEVMPTVLWPAVPLWPMVAVVCATLLLTLVATVVPTRLATRVAPVEALAAD